MSDTTEFSRTVPVDRIGCHQTHKEIAATPDECAAIATRLKLEGVTSLTAEFTLRCGVQPGLFEVVGKAKAKVTQICVIGGDPFTTKVDTKINALFSEADVEMEGSFDDQWDDIESVANGQIDLGELAVQYLSLALDPYPRKPGAEWPTGDDQPVKPESPFAVLKALNKN